VTGIAVHHHHIWDVDKVKSLIADRSEAVTFFCGGSRNFGKFIGLFDAVFVLEVDAETLAGRLDGRPRDEWGGREEERRLIERLHLTRTEIPSGAIPINAAAPLPHVVDDILRRVQAGGRA
jgi:hypothetical protein